MDHHAHERETSPLDGVPDEVLALVLSGLAAGDDLARCAMTSKRFASVARDPAVQAAWRARCEAAIARLGVDPRLPCWTLAARSVGWHWVERALAPMGDDALYANDRLTIGCRSVGDGGTVTMLTCGQHRGASLHGLGVRVDPANGLWAWGEWAGDGRCMQGHARMRHLVSRVYEGPVLCGLPHGRGSLTEERDGVVRYEGEFRWGEYGGEGRERDNGGNLHEGTFRHGRPHGSATITSVDGRARERSTWVDGERHGTYTMTLCGCALDDMGWDERAAAVEAHHAASPNACHDFGARITCTYRHGYAEGRRTMHYHNGDVHVRDYVRGAWDGRATYTVSDSCPDPRFRGSVLTGIWMNVHLRQQKPENIVCPDPHLCRDLFARFWAYARTGLLPVVPPLRSAAQIALAQRAASIGMADADAAMGE
jgi:hypothetical protein